jgi:hypothetical protein
MRLNGTDEAIDSHEYPATGDELIDAYGDLEIEVHDGSETVAEVLGRLGGTTYEGPEDVREALFSAVSHEAVGRRFYSDRDAPVAGEGPDPVSF